MKSLLYNHTLWRGTWVDIWTLPHFIFGFLFAGATVWIGVDMWLGFSVTAMCAVAWEIFERVTGLSSDEAFTNSLFDIVAAFIGFSLGIPAFRHVTGKHGRIFIIVAGILIFAVLCGLGYYRLVALGLP